MTCIAWDGKTIAADRLASNGNTVRHVTKLKRLASGGVVAIVGNVAMGMRRRHWFESGAAIDEWPETDGDEYTCLVIWDCEGLRFYEDGPFPLPVEDEFWAFGCGRDFAIAAMACGKSAREAVEIANRFDNGCGLGVDVMTLESKAGDIGN